MRRVKLRVGSEFRLLISYESAYSPITHGPSVGG